MNNGMPKARIMIVEDESIIAEEIRMTLGKLGYATTSISNSGEKAIERAKTENPDAVLMDINLKGRMDGVEAADVIRQSLNIPVIFLTAHADDDKIDRAKVTMPFGYILKPFRERDLKIAVEMALHIAAVQRERDKARKENRLNTLRLEIIHEIATLKDADEKKISDLVLERMVDLSDSKIGFLGFMTEDEQTMMIHSWSKSAMAECRMNGKPIEFPIAQAGLWGEPVRNRKPMIYNDYSAPHEAKKGCPEGHVRITRFMCVPVFDNARIVAVAAVGNKDLPYAPMDERQLNLLMQGMWEQIRRKRMDDRIAESELKFRKLFEEAQDGIALADTETGIIIDCNSALAQLVERNVSELIGQPQSILHPTSDVNCGFSRDFARYRHGRAAQTLEEKVITRRGTIKHVEIKSSPFVLKGREVVQGIFRDITERKRIEEELRFQSRILDQIQDHVTATDLKGNILYVNAAQTRTMKRSREELLNSSVLSYGDDPGKGATQKQIIENTLKNGEWRGEVVNYTPDGEEIILDCRTTLITESEGKPMNMIGIASDITERKRAEELLRLSHTRYQQLVDFARDGIFTLDNDGRFLFVNEGICDALGYSREELLRLSILDTYPEEMWDHGQQRLSMLGQGKTVQFERPMKCKDGSFITIEARCWKTEDGNMQAIVRDITERRRAEEEKVRLEDQLRKAQKMESIGTLAGGIAHDFNNILFPIVGRCEMLLDGMIEDKKLIPHITSILKSAHRATGLVKQILAFSRQSEAGTMPVRIQKIIHEVMSLIRHSIPSTIDIALAIDETCNAISADAGQVHQVIMNLITNAYHAMEETGGRLEIGLKEIHLDPENSPEKALPPGRYVDLYVSDTGTGIDEEIMSRIFDPYFTTKEVGKGTGLGLAVSYGIVKKHQGAIRVSSRTGEGSIFHVYLPVMKDEFVKQTPEPGTVVRGGAEHILFVDDELDIVETSLPLLEQLGYRVTVRTGSVEALAAFCNDPDRFDLVVTDMTMPNMTGIQLAGEIHKIRPGFPIILCTGFSLRIDEDNARQLGIRAYVMKPIVRDQLAVAIRRILDGAGD